MVAISGYDCAVYLFSDFTGEPAVFPVRWQYPRAAADRVGERIWIVQRSGPSHRDSTLVDGFVVGTGRNFVSKTLDAPYSVEAVVGNKLLMVSENERVIFDNGYTTTFLRCNIFNLERCPEVVGVNEQEHIALAYYETVTLYIAGPGYKAGPEEYDYEINEIVVVDMRTKEFLHKVEKPGPGKWKSVRIFNDWPIYAAADFLAIFVSDGEEAWSLYRVKVESGAAEHLVTVAEREIPSDFPQRNHRLWTTAEGEILYEDGSSVSVINREDGTRLQALTLPEGFRVRDVWPGAG